MQVQNQQNKKRKPQQNQVPNPALKQSPPPNSLSSPNLFTYNERKYIGRFKSIFVLTILIQVGFLAVVLLNYRINTSLNALNSQVLLLEQQVEENQELFFNVKTLSLQTDLLKQAESSKTPLFSSVNDIISSFSHTSSVQDPLFLNLSVNENVALLSLQTARPLNVAVLIERLLGSDITERVVITSAVLDDVEETYLVDLEMEFSL